MSHRFLWDKSINGHTCSQCGMVRPTASASQNESRQRAQDRMRSLADSLGMYAYLRGTVGVIGSQTSQGMAEWLFLIDEMGDILQSQYVLNSKAIDGIPLSFRKFHAGFTTELRDAVICRGVNEWIISKAEDAGECLA